jgi:hypothetical protein
MASSMQGVRMGTHLFAHHGASGACEKIVDWFGQDKTSKRSEGT